MGRFKLINETLLRWFKSIIWIRARTASKTRKESMANSCLNSTSLKFWKTLGLYTVFQMTKKDSISSDKELRSLQLCLLWIPLLLPKLKNTKYIITGIIQMKRLLMKSKSKTLKKITLQWKRLKKSKPSRRTKNQEENLKSNWIDTSKR